MKTLMTLILSSSFLLTACGKDSKSSSSATPTPAPKPIAAVDKATDEKKDPAIPLLSKIVDGASAPTQEGDPSQFERAPKEYSDKDKASAEKKSADKAAGSQTKPEPKKEAVSPKKETVAAKKETVAPKKEVAAPTKQTPAPKKEKALESVKKSPAQAKASEKSPAKTEQAQKAPAQKTEVVKDVPRAQVAPAQTSVPCETCGTGNLKASQPEFPGLEVTGSAANADQSYITLVNDGLMTAIKREMTRGGGDQIRANTALARSLTNGRLYIDPASGERLVAVKVVENNRVQTYNYRVAAYTNRLKPMRLVIAGPHTRTTGSQDMRASLACMDTCGKCEVAVLKLELGGAKAYAILRSPTTDLKFRLNQLNSQNPDVADFRRFFLNLNNAKVETFEVAYGVSMIRTMIVGKNGEMFSQVAPLIHSTRGALNAPMRSIDQNPEDLDRVDLENRPTSLSAKLALASLVQVDGNGGLTANYKTKNLSSNIDGDGFQVKFKARPTEVFPMTGALLH